MPFNSYPRPLADITPHISSVSNILPARNRTNWNQVRHDPGFYSFDSTQLPTKDIVCIRQEFYLTEEPDVTHPGYRNPFTRTEVMRADQVDYTEIADAIEEDPDRGFLTYTLDILCNFRRFHQNFFPGKFNMWKMSSYRWLGENSTMWDERMSWGCEYVYVCIDINRNNAIHFIEGNNVVNNRIRLTQDEIAYSFVHHPPCTNRGFRFRGYTMFNIPRYVWDWCMWQLSYVDSECNLYVLGH